MVGHLIDLEKEFLVATVSQDGKTIGIDHPTDADWRDVLFAHVSLRDRLNERLTEMDKCPFKPKENEMAEHVDSSSDDRTANNTVRHQYRVLNDKEKEAMLEVKDQGAKLLSILDSHCGQCRETSIAKTKVEEAVMWAVKGITG